MAAIRHALPANVRFLFLLAPQEGISQRYPIKNEKQPARSISKVQAAFYALCDGSTQSAVLHRQSAQLPRQALRTQRMRNRHRQAVRRIGLRRA